MTYRGRLDWLLRPIAHRGLHDSKNGIIENSASAVRASIEAGYGLEVDLQAARDGEPVVFHDATLDRLTGEAGKIGERSLVELCQIPLTASADYILSLAELLDLVAGRVPLVLEIKSGWSEDRRLETNIAKALAAYAGPAAVMSFDPNSVAAFHRLAPNRPRGLVAETFQNRAHAPDLSPLRRFAMRHLLTAAIAKPHFIAYDVKALPAAAPALARALGRPLLTWTVRSEADRKTAELHADAIIFEHLRP